MLHFRPHPQVYVLDKNIKISPNTKIKKGEVHNLLNFRTDLNTQLLLRPALCLRGDPVIFPYSTSLRPVRSQQPCRLLLVQDLTESSLLKDLSCVDRGPHHCGDSCGDLETQGPYGYRHQVLRPYLFNEDRYDDGASWDLGPLTRT